MKINQIIKKLGHIKESLKECTKETNNQVIYDIDHQIARLEILIDDIDSFGVDDCDCGDGNGVLNEHCDCENENGIPNYVDDRCDGELCNNKLTAEQIGSDGMCDDCGGEYDENSNLFEKLKKEFATALVYSKPWNDGAMLLNDVAIFDVLEHVFKEKK